MRRINLLRAHGSPRRYHYTKGCRCVACGGQRAAYNAAYYAAHREQGAVRAVAYRATHREEISRQQRDSRLRRQYGLLPDEWDAMFAAQGNGCAICQTTEPGGKYNQWHTDHDHDTGLTRGLLCHNCNVGIGHFRDDPAHLMAAIRYLQAAS